MLRNIKTSEIEKYILEKSKQYGIPNPEKYTANSMKQLTESDKEQIAKDFIVFDLNGEMISGASLWDKRYLQNILFHNEYLESVIRLLTEENHAIRFYLNSIPNKFHPTMLDILEKLNFEKHTLYDLSKHVFGLIDNLSLSLTNFENHSEEEIENIYNYHKRLFDFSWETIKYTAGGGINPKLSFFDDSTKTIIIVASPSHASNEAIYTVTYFKSDTYSSVDLIRFIENQIYNFNPEGIINLHVTEENLPSLLEKNYKISNEQLYFDFPQTIS